MSRLLYFKKVVRMHEHLKNKVVKLFMKKILAVLIVLILPIISFADEIFIPVELWLGANISQSEKKVFPEVSFKFSYK